MTGMEILAKTLEEAGYEGELGSFKGKKYKILWELEQRSDLWRTLRENSCGGTGAYRLLKKGYEAASQEKSTLHHATFATQWGADHEEPARQAFSRQPVIKEFLEKENLIGVEAGMILRPDIKKKCHYSPDWLLVDKDNRNLIKGLCEIKAFQAPHHLKIIKAREADTTIQCQMQFGMFMCQVNYCFFIAYNPTLEGPERLFIKKYKKDRKYQKAFKELLSE